MEKKTYKAPRVRVHGIMMETTILSGSEPGSTELNGNVYMAAQTALGKGCGGPIIDDDDFEDDDFDY